MAWENRIVETVEMDPRTLTPNPLNWRTHPEGQAQVLGAVLEKVGVVAQVTYNRRTGHLIDGHLRQKMAIARGEKTIPVNVVDLSIEEEREVLLTFDPIVGLAEVDAEQMRVLAEQTQSDDPTIAAFIESLVSEMAPESEAGPAGEGRAIEEADEGPDERMADELREKWGTDEGQLWAIPSKSGRGAHMLLIADSTDRATPDRLLQGSKAALLISSPPYWANQEYDTPADEEQIRAFMYRVAGTWSAHVSRRVVIQTGSTTNTAAAGKGDRGDKIGRESIKAGPMDKLWLDAMWSGEWRGHGWLSRYRRFWLKNGLMLHPAPFSDLVNEGVEVLVCLYRPGHNEGGQERVGEDWALAGWWELPGVKSDGHPCPFPVEIPRRNVLLYSREGDLVLDPFAGQGTTLEACELTGRLGRGVEIDPAYAAVALERLSLMGLTPAVVS